MVYSNIINVGIAFPSCNLERRKLAIGVKKLKKIWF